MKAVDTVLIFKTNIRTVADKCHLKKVLDEHEHIQQWSIDQQDVDCVLRIVSQSASPEQIINLINHYGYQCSELS